MTRFSTFTKREAGTRQSLVNVRYFSVFVFVPEQPVSKHHFVL